MTTNIGGHAVTNTIHIVVDEVTYGTGGRWGQWAHGGGSSLELMDARSDRRLAPNWADSDETAKSPWMTIEFTGVLDNGNGAADSLQTHHAGRRANALWTTWRSSRPAARTSLPTRISNPDSTGWVPQGNHEDSSLGNRNQGFNGSPCLHVRAAGPGDTGANRIRTAADLDC